MIAPAAKPLRVVLLGPPASGKGTQGRRLAASLGLGYLSTGALLREHVGAGTELGKQAEPILARGEYLPDDLMCPILADWLSRQTGGWVLDGFPRSLPQAVFLDEWLAAKDLKIDAAVSLEVPFSELIARIHDRVECPSCRWTGQKAQLATGGTCPACYQPAGPRADDSEENFRSRHAEFVNLTVPVIDHYRASGQLSACDATAPQDEVAARLLRSFAG
ncbi:MAG: nucleoside monophosphate kinase [Luteolibacter sp.]|uniref:adenylate kinase family protein n=1 Tax=Luteolibacter sp. TaxID=1962973 RepID=UPI003264AE19